MAVKTPYSKSYELYVVRCILVVVRDVDGYIYSFGLSIQSLSGLATSVVSFKEMIIHFAGRQIIVWYVLIIFLN